MEASGPLAEARRPTVAQSALYVAALVVLVAAAVRLGQVARSGESGATPGTVVWVAALYTLIASYPAMLRGSAVCLLISAVAFGVVVVEFIDWVDPGPLSATGTRWALFGLMLLYGGAAVALRRRRAAYSAQLVNAAMVGVLALLEFTDVALISGDERSTSASTWWEIVMLAGACAGIAYGVWTRERGPAWVGGAGLLAAALVIGQPSGSATLVGWPLVFLILAALALGAGFLLPRRT